MNFQFYLEKLHHADTFNQFKKENPDAFLTSGFFTVDKKGNDNKAHFDFYDPKLKKLYSFKLEEECVLVPVEEEQEREYTKINDNHAFHLKEIETMIRDRMEDEQIKNDIEKLIFSLQNVDGKDTLFGTVFISMLGLLKVDIDLETNDITVFEKKSFFDLLRIKRKD